MEISNKNNLLKISMHYGAIAGGVISAPIIMFYFFGNINSPQLPSIQHILCFPAIAIFIRWYRDKFSDGETSFKIAFKLGFLLILFASVIIAFVTFLFYTLNSTIFFQYLDLMKETVSSIPNNEDLKKLWLDSINIITPTTMAIGKIFEFNIFGLIFSLLIAHFVRKQKIFYKKA